MGNTGAQKIDADAVKGSRATGCSIFALRERAYIATCKAHIKVIFMTDNDTPMQTKESKKDTTAKGKKNAKDAGDGEKKKRGPTSFIIFSTEKRPEVLKKNPNLKVPEVAKVLGALWKELSDAEKAKYRVRAEEAKNQ